MGVDESELTKKAHEGFWPVHEDEPVEK